MSENTDPRLSKPSKDINKPFMVQQKYLAEKARKQKAGVQDEPDPVGTALGVMFKWIFVAFLTSTVLSRALTETWVWGQDQFISKRIESCKRDASRLLVYGTRDVNSVIISEHELALHDGSNEKYPVWIAIDSDVYDVSLTDTGRRTYGPGGTYSIFSGRDAARSYITGCFKPEDGHLTYDLRGIDEEGMKALENWKNFFANHHTYQKVGRVSHPPIPEDKPIPQNCKDPKK